MDIPPTIPTSFVPRSASVIARHSGTGVTGIYGLSAYVILGIVFVFALGTFVYDRVLAGMQSSRGASLEKAEKAIDLATVEGFVQLRNRLNSGTMLLANHVALSKFFAILETVLPTSVRLTSLHLSFDATKQVKLDGTGVAKSFNALAAVSTAFANDGRIKEAIFSNLIVNKDSSVSFVLSATIDPKVVAFSP
ncbi:hypothetical protein A2950_01845 [Candidatus Kaiserbacteria bacterium RIFCSPLOWO2_01_FULL_55_19]|uniref:Uncharacterized protein n=1 Tax=Candidatus Kaiserbacteria bacterium RIFCSPLOWO2_01_FULL_55_19 TaxID=1798516 RepID=A0A1F6ERS5_9BACT|nr:MAG: hypothetical protein A2950_01845 [Candidatus Kaiserbacteria bacterium RIFCSPLOWO2_01_FULL_55_19]